MKVQFCILCGKEMTGRDTCFTPARQYCEVEKCRNSLCLYTIYKPSPKPYWKEMLNPKQLERRDITVNIKSWREIPQIVENLIGKFDSLESDLIALYQWDAFENEVKETRTYRMLIYPSENMDYKTVC